MSSGFNKLEMRIEGLENEFDDLVSSNETLLLNVQKGIFSISEFIGLLTFLRSIRPVSSTKYYTKEVEKNLMNISLRILMNLHRMMFLNLKE